MFTRTAEEHRFCDGVVRLDLAEADRMMAAFWTAFTGGHGRYLQDTELNVNSIRRRLGLSKG